LARAIAVLTSASAGVFALIVAPVALATTPKNKPAARTAGQRLHPKCFIQVMSTAHLNPIDAKSTASCEIFETANLLIEKAIVVPLLA
jgi:hypothetical protein